MQGPPENQLIAEVATLLKEKCIYGRKQPVECTRTCATNSLDPDGISTKSAQHSNCTSVIHYYVCAELLLHVSLSLSYI